MFNRFALLCFMRVVCALLIGTYMPCYAVGFTDKRIEKVEKISTEQRANGLSVIYELSLSGNCKAFVTLFYEPRDEETVLLHPEITLPTGYLPNEHARNDAFKVIMQRVYASEGIQTKSDEAKRG